MRSCYCFFFLTMGNGKGKEVGQRREREQPVGQAELAEKEQKKERNEKLKNYRNRTFAIVIFKASNSIVCKKIKLEYRKTT